MEHYLFISCYKFSIFSHEIIIFRHLIFQQISEKRLEKTNWSTIFLCYVIEKLYFFEIRNILENPQILRREFLLCSSSQSQPPKSAYPLYLWPRSKVWIRAHEASIQTAATKVTNIGDRRSLVASVLPLPAATQDL